MAIYKAVRKDLGTGSITGESQQSYVVPYYVFTDNTDSPASIYAKARSEHGIMLYDSNNNPTNEKLPVYGTIDDSNLKVSNINIERASENNLIAVAQYGLAVKEVRDTSYTCWNYVVTFTDMGTTTITTGDAPWNKDEAISCSFSPKTYERYDNKTLVPNYSEKNDSIVIPNYPLYEEKYQNLQNTVGDDLYRSRTIYNYLLNFSYAVRRFDAEWLPLFMNTMNLKDCVICGIPIKKYHAAINELRVEQAEWNGITYYNVNVEVEIQYQQRITYDEYVSSGHRACMIEGSTSAINSYLTQRDLTKEKSGFVFKYTDSDTVKKYPVPIEELTDIRMRDEIPDRRWFMKKKNLGYFEDIFKLEENEEVVPIRRRVYKVSGTYPPSQVGATLVVKYTPNIEEETGIYVTMYYTGKSKDNTYMYSIYNPESEEYETKDPTQFRYMKKTTATINGESEDIYSMTKYVVKHTQTKVPADPFVGQYNTIQNPLALNKYGGVYLAENDSTTVDDVTQPGKIDMYDPMLGKVKDYQHIARDWTALGFPKKGMFWSITSDNNFMMTEVSNYLK